ncbi:MAG: sigma-70 family RNA polymerase sigma factor [Clostridia bacterium]|nr:sigma-70 family RNA polymerase sigma factor [Clostridia bacterium]MBQ8743555.1 sigma-70 family RNA polymerase sigma factor [Clostridia bacterium]
MELKSKQNEKMPMDDAKIVELYFRRDEKAIEETDFKYKKYLFSVAYNLLHDRLDCEECLSDTYLGAWNAIPPSRPNVLKAFLTTIARRVAIKRYHAGLRKRTIPSELTVSLSELEAFVSGDEDVCSDFDAERLGSVISDFLRSLSERRRFIFMSRYYVADPIDTIASDLGLSRSTVNKELAAIRSDLKEKLESEGYLI